MFKKIFMITVLSFSLYSFGANAGDAEKGKKVLRNVQLVIMLQQVLPTKQVPISGVL